MGDVVDTGQRLGREARRSDWLDHAVRFGMVVYGVVHLVLAWLALQLALGDREGSTSTSGALRELAQQPFGAAVIWAVAAGMALLVLWRLLDATAGHRSEDDADRWRHRATDLLKAVLYGALAWSAVRIATSPTGGGSSGSSSDTLTARVMGWPGGQLLVGAAGLAVLGYAGLLVWRGLSEKYLEHLATEGRTGEAGRAYLLLGKVGHIAKGMAIGVVGILFVYAAATHDAQRSGGLDQALREVLRQPFGPWLLGAIAVGIGCYGLFCFARARHLDR